MTENDEIADAQIFPFFLYSRELAEQYQIEVRDLPLHRFLEARDSQKFAVDAVCFQTWFGLSSEELNTVVGRIKSQWPDAALAYLDWFAPTDLRYAEILNPSILAYLKKQVLRDFSLYGGVTQGDTNLTDYYSRRFRINLPETRFSIPPGFEQKLLLGAGFEYSPAILDNLRKRPKFTARHIDLHARISVDGTEWYTQMRQEAFAKAADLDGRFRVTYRGRVSRSRYFTELRNSKLCFSPFGYGEVCWRDFESMSTGSLLLKPDMSHLRLANDFFKPFETYVPLAWDLSDLEDKVSYYLKHSSERQYIAQNAFEILHQHYQQKRFLRDTAPLWQELRLL